MEEDTKLVRLNVEIPKGLLRRAKIRAVETDRDLRTIVIEALEGALAKPPKKAVRS